MLGNLKPYAKFVITDLQFVTIKMLASVIGLRLQMPLSIACTALAMYILFH